MYCTVYCSILLTFGITYILIDILRVWDWGSVWVAKVDDSSSASPVYLLHRSRDQHPQLLRRRAPGWTCRPRALRGEPPCTLVTPLRCWWRSQNRRSPRRSCPGAALSESRTCSAGGWTARRFVPSVASWCAGPGRPLACFSGVGLVDSWGTARFLSSCPCYAICLPCSKSLCLYRESVDRCSA